jgi:arylsulfatase A-like enzyme
MKKLSKDFMNKDILVSFALLSLILCSCSKSDDNTEVQVEQNEIRNLIIISIDTLRADRLGCYGYNRSTSPMIDQLAKRGVRFETVIAESSWTLPSHMTLFTGFYPGNHGLTLEDRRLPPNITTLAEVLKDGQYRTFAYTDGGFVNSKYGFGRGFEVYKNNKTSFAAKLKLAERCIDRLKPGEKFFLFLHTFDVHCPYDPEKRYASMFRTCGPEDFIDTKGRCGNLAYNNKLNYNSMILSPGQTRFLSDQYDASIRQADDALAKFVQYLDYRKAFDNTFLVVLSDHGEEFMEHGQIGHERTLYIESLSVPLIIVGPGIEQATVHEGIGLVNVAPTLIELLDIDAPFMQGESVVALIKKSNTGSFRQRLFSDLDRHVRLRSVVENSYHLIYSPDKNSYEIYDFSKDSMEKKDLSVDEPSKAEELLDIVLEQFNNVKKPETGSAVELSSEEIEKLHSLGYVN